MAEPTGRGEQKHEFLILKKFRSLNTQPSREALAEDEFAWNENIMPIGNAYMKVVPQVGGAIATVTAAIAAKYPATLGTVNYQICFTTAGGAQAVNLGNSSVVTITAGGTFTGTPAMDQWKSERVVIADSSGMYSWDGSLFYSPGSVATISVTTSGSAYTATPAVVLTGGTVGTTASATAILSAGGVSSISLVSVGAGYTTAPAVTFSGGTTATVGLATASAYIMPTGMGGDAIAVYAGRVWSFNGRLLSFTAPNTWYDVNTANAAGSATITEGSLREKIYAAKALDNYLYIFGDSSIIIIGDLKVSGAVTTYSQTFLSSTTGTTLPHSITALERAILFVNKYGVYALFGASVQKVSKALDGIFPDIDFTQEVSAGLAQIYNILCYVFSFTYNDENSTRPIQALLFDGKWFLTSQGALTFIAPATLNGVPSLWGTTGTDVRQLYANTTATISSTLQTGLYDLGNPIFDKQLIRAAVEWTAPTQAEIDVQIDTETISERTTFSSDSSILWLNNNGNPIVWVNTATATISWISTGFVLADGNFALIGKYLGATITSNSPGIAINGTLMEYVQRAPWSR
jgi:hypothetical protein